MTTGFVIATVLVMPLTAFLGRFFGQKRVYMFSLGAVSSSAPPSAAWPARCRRWCFCRALQGLGAGALQPTEQAILRQTFPPEEQGMAMALFGLAVVVGPAVGPTLGGYIIDNCSWPWIFYINVPVGLLGIFMVTRFVHEPEDIRRANRERAAEQRKNLDWQGVLLMTTGLASLQYVLEEGSRNDWFSSMPVAVCTFAGRLPADRLRHPRADRAGAGGRPVAVQGQGVPLRDAHRGDHVLHPDVDHLPAAGLHAGAAGILRGPVGRWRSCRGRSP